MFFIDAGHDLSFADDAPKRVFVLIERGFANEHKNSGMNRLN
jgi:hypothetical protein